MTAYYISATGSDSLGGTSWAAAWLTMNKAYNTINDGDVVYVDKNSTIAATSGVTVGYSNNPYISADSSQATPTSASGCVVSTTGILTLAGPGGYYEGFTFAAANIALKSDSARYKNCTFNPSSSTAGAAALSVQPTNNVSGPFGMGMELEDCTINLNNSSQTFTQYGGRFVMRGGAVNSSVTLLNLIATSIGGGYALFEGVDFTGMSCSALVGSLTYPMTIIFRRCKLNASFVGSIAQQRALVSGVDVYLIECDVAGSGPSYRYEHDTLCGETRAKTSVYRIGGAVVSGFNISWECTVRKALWPNGFYTPDLGVYNDATANPITVSIEFLASADNLSVGDVWLELSYLGDASSMKGTTVSSGAVNYSGKGVLLTKSVASWNTVPSGFVAYKISMTISPKQVGVINGRLRASKVMTINVDPNLTVI